MPGWWALAAAAAGAEWDCHTAQNTDIGQNVYLGEEADKAACEAACLSHGDCGAAVWNAGNDHCNLKVGSYSYDQCVASLKANAQYESCCLNGTRPPGPPPPTPPPPIPTACTGNLSALPFCDTGLPPPARAADLVSRLTLEEKVPQLSTFSFTSQHSGRTPGVPRLGIAEYNYHSEGLHGVRDSCDSPATLYPQVTAMAATGNLSLVREMAEVMGRQSRAAYNAIRAKGSIKSKGCGLSYYGPTMNIIRDPRWGRSQESVSEDPFLNGAYAVNFIGGVQGDYDKVGYLQVAGCCKHLTAYSVENGRMGKSNAVVSKQDLMETYLPAFRACAGARPQQVMCAYNEINGTGACYDGDIQNTLMRGQWGFNGSIVSDCDAIKIHLNNYPSPEEATAAGLRGGCDQDCGSAYSDHALSAVQKAVLAEAEVDVALRRIFEMRFKLGEFDPPGRNPYDGVPTGISDDAFSRDSALRAARESVCLLNNSAGVLPLARNASVAVVGPLSACTKCMFGAKSDYSPSHVVSIVEGMTALATAPPTHADGCADVKCASDDGFAAAVAAAKAADVAVFVGGIDSSIEREGADRPDSSLPAGQLALLKALVAAVGPRRVVAVLVNGGPVASDYLAATVPSVLEAFEGGQAAGTAVAETLFGANNPSGVLPYTVYPEDYVNQVSMTDFNMRPSASSPGRTYRFYTGTPLWGFGDGGSYTTWSLKWSDGGGALTATAGDAGAVSAKVTVQNTGRVAGAKVVMAFSASSAPGAPLRTLFGVQKVFLAPGEQAELTFSAADATAMGFCAFCSVDAGGTEAAAAGEWSLLVGTGTKTALRRTVTLTGARAVHQLPPW